MEKNRNRALVALGALLAPLIVAEGAFRLLGLQAADRQGKKMQAQPDATSQKGRQDREDYNSLGFHDTEWELKKSPESIRIAVLGDSFTEGKSVHRDRTFVSIAEAMLNQKDKVELLNVGRGGWDTEKEHQALDMLLERGFEIDAVIVVYFINDATGMNSTPRLIADLETYVSSRSGVLNRFSRVYDFLDYRMRRKHVTQTTLSKYRKSFYGDTNAKEQWTRSQDALASIKERCDTHRLPVGVALFPVLFQLNEDHALLDIYTLIENVCDELGMPFLNLLPAFIGEDDRLLWVSERDAHPNARGHALAAPLFADFLEHQILAQFR